MKKELQKDSREQGPLSTAGTARCSPRRGLGHSGWASLGPHDGCLYNTALTSWDTSTPKPRGGGSCLALLSDLLQKAPCWGPDSPTSRPSPRPKPWGLPPEHHEASLPVLLAQVGGARLVMQHAFFGDGTLGG